MMILFGRASVVGFLSLFLNFTSVLWAPQNWLFWLQWVLMFGENPTFVDISPLVGNPAPACLTYSEIKEAVNADASDVSGWYGPGAYLAWLFTLYVGSIKSIWNGEERNRGDDKTKPEQKDKDAIDGELLASLTYPAVAILDIMYRLIRCKVDPTLDASMLVIFVSVLSLGTARRLASPPDADKWANGDIMFPSGKRQWTVSTFLVICHCIVFGTIAESFNDLRILATVYSLAFGCILYSAVKSERKMDRHPYRVEEVRPRLERTIAFIVFQGIFLMAVGASRGSVMPRTGSRLSDLDQCATLITVIVATIFSSRAGIMKWAQTFQPRVAGFRRLRPVPASWRDGLP